jgi:hypothetical protein
MALSHSPSIVTDGLVLCLDAANTKSYPGTGTGWNDLSQNSFVGTMVNGITFSSSNLGSIVFDGTDDYVTIPHNSAFNFNTSLSLSFWFKTSVGTEKYLTTKSDDSFYVAIGTVSPGKLSTWLNGTSPGGWKSSTASVDTNQWVNGVVTYNGSSVFIYINGSLDSSFGGSGGVSTGTSPVGIGYRNSAYFFNGSIANVMFYNINLSASQIAQNFNALRGRFGI